MTPVATHLTTRRYRGRTNLPTIAGFSGISINRKITGTATTPLTTADKNSARIGFIPQNSSTPKNRSGRKNVVKLTPVPRLALQARRPAKQFRNCVTFLPSFRKGTASPTSSCLNRDATGTSYALKCVIVRFRHSPMIVLDPISRKGFLVGWNIHRQFQKSPPFEGNSSHCRKPAPHCKSDPNGAKTSEAICR